LVLILDSLDLLGSNNQLGNPFFDPLRSLNAQYDVVYLTGSERPLHEVASKAAGEHGSPFFNIFKEFVVGSLSQDEALKMLDYYCRSIFMDDLGGVLMLIAERTAGHPHLLQRMGWRLIELLRGNEWQWNEVCHKALLQDFDGL